MDILHSASGFLVGLLVGLTGVGGGALMTPLLVLMFGIAPGTAVGTDLWFAAITKIFGGATHSRSRNIDWEIVRRLALGSIPASILCLIVMAVAGIGKAGNGGLTMAIAIALIISAVAMLMKGYLHRFGQELRTRIPREFKSAQPLLTTLAGAVLGVLVTLTSVGAGSLCAVILLYLYPFRLSPAKLVGTDIVHAIPLAIVAGMGHLLLGNVDFVLLAALLLGSIPGVIIGAALAPKFNENVLRLVMAVALLSVAYKLLS